jgi:hypothetical protein
MGKELGITLNDEQRAVLDRSLPTPSAAVFQRKKNQRRISLTNYYQIIKPRLAVKFGDYQMNKQLIKPIMLAGCAEN